MSTLALFMMYALAIIAMLALFLINFYRDPERKIPSGNNIVSPADGKIISILT
ncbi:MAG: phosphatidylserine decarboxylase, partial [Nanoarchaeota archaeon]